MPYPASVIAYAFVKKGIAERKFVTQMKLQKMVFFAHGYHLAKFNEPLIFENFEAWKFGPVVPGIYQEFKYFGSKPITGDDLLLFSLSSQIEGYKLDKHALEAIDYTWEVTKDVDALVLSNWTHQPASPWYQVYKPDEWSTPIDNESIRDFFKALLTNKN